MKKCKGIEIANIIINIAKAIQYRVIHTDGFMNNVSGMNEDIDDAVYRMECAHIPIERHIKRLSGLINLDIYAQKVLLGVINDLIQSCEIAGSSEDNKTKGYSSFDYFDEESNFCDDVSYPEHKKMRCDS